MARIRLWGGFHNSPETTIIVNKKFEDRLQDLERGFISLDDVITPYQHKRLEKHFCGIGDCLCYSFPSRVKFEIVR